MKNCSGINCPMQYGVVDTATCPSVECCPYATPPLTNADCIRSMTDVEIEAWYWWMHKEMMYYTDSEAFVHDWLRQEAE